MSSGEATSIPMLLSAHRMFCGAPTCTTPPNCPRITQTINAARMTIRVGSLSMRSSFHVGRAAGAARSQAREGIVRPSNSSIAAFTTASIGSAFRVA